MLTRPEGISDELLADRLRLHWGLALAEIEYRPVGFGSHHWAATAVDGSRRFVTVDGLAGRRRTDDEPLAAAFARLHAALATARSLADAGGSFVVAPIPTRDGKPSVRMEPGTAVALYPFVDGESFSWGTVAPPAHTRGLLEMIVALHRVSPLARRHAMSDDFFVPHRDRLEAALAAGRNAPTDSGPYAEPIAKLLAANARRIGAFLRRYDALVGEARRSAVRAVLTHGEPHPGNTMRTAAGWLLVDWDTVLIAPPERDLWMLHQRDDSVLSAYARETGTVPESSLLELYRLRWDLADLAVYVDRFSRAHLGNADDVKSWAGLSALVDRLPAA